MVLQKTATAAADWCDDFSTEEAVEYVIEALILIAT